MLLVLMEERLSILKTNHLEKLRIEMAGVPRCFLTAVAGLRVVVPFRLEKLGGVKSVPPRGIGWVID